MTPLLDALIELLGGWRAAFPRQRSFLRAISHVLALSAVLGRRTITRVILLKGAGYRKGWNSEYKLFSRSPWDPPALFCPVWNEYLRRYPTGPIRVAVDETGLQKIGRSIPDVQWMRDPLSPPFQTNLMLGLRFLQASLLFPHYREQDCPARAMPVNFQQSTRVRKPGKRATDEQKTEYRKAVKKVNLSTHALALFGQLREQADGLGATERVLWLAVDGSFANQTIFRAALSRTELIARCRKDARLCYPAPKSSKRVYDPEGFTPEQVLNNADIPFQEAFVYLAGGWRTIRYKEINGVLWQGGAGRRLLRLIVVEPQPYRRSPNSRIRRRDPSFLLITDLLSCAVDLLQVYCDRWQIEVNHFEEKSIFGVGEAQVRSPRSVPRHPALAVAGYSLLLLAGLMAFGPGRTDDYQTLPRWRRQSKRPSILDLLTVLRAEIHSLSLNKLENRRETGDETDINTLVAAIPPAFDADLVRHAFT